MREPIRIDAGCAAPGCRAPRAPHLTLRLLLLLPLLSGMLRALGFRRTYATLAGLSARAVRRAARGPGALPAEDHLVEQARDVADIVVHVNRHLLPYQSRCLLESLALWFLLRRRGLPADLLLGARTLYGPLEAHAWVEIDGRALNDTANVRHIYAAFDPARPDHIDVPLGTP